MPPPVPSTVEDAEAPVQTEPAATAFAATPVATTPGDAPVDARLEPISLTHLSVEAKEALRLCVREGEIPLVSGMAELASARDVPRYGWFFGKPPELQTDAPAWVVQFDGDVAARTATLHDPTCVVIDGVRTLFGTGGVTSLDGRTERRSELAVAPELSLPPLMP
jgi:hypothetical protein